VSDQLNTIVGLLHEVHATTQQHAIRQVNQALTARNWLFGYYLSETELGGKRAIYGDEALKSIATALSQSGVKGMTQSALYRCMQFYSCYPYIFATLSQKLALPKNQENRIFATLSQKTQTAEKPIDAELLFTRLNYSHFLELMKIDDAQKRQYYEVLAIKGNLSVRDLKRAIDAMEYERIGLAKHRQKNIQVSGANSQMHAGSIIKSPMVLEFLGIAEQKEISESELEQSIIDHLQEFLMELGRGFCFEARQKRITFDNHHYYIDLVFYHRILKCHVLIDLKIGEFHHADAGQMNLYLNYYKENEHEEGDASPIGIVLCADKNDALVHYATGGMSQELFVRKYMLQLPSIAQLKALVQEETERLNRP
jgi:predicted nuclease of restriction endonuclease-like (RecB) superfamily